MVLEHQKNYLKKSWKKSRHNIFSKTCRKTIDKIYAIVNAANTELLMGGGVCGAIFNAAGAKELQEACDKKSPIKTGDAVITPGFKLPAKFVIHAAGPVYICITGTVV